MSTDELSALASLGSATVAVLALIVAVVAAIATWKTNRAQQMTLELQRKQFEVLEARNERDQASKVTFVVVSNESATASEKLHRVLVSNDSDQPVFDVVILWGSTSSIVFAQHRVPPNGNDEIYHLLTKSVDATDPGSMHFRDANGIRWERLQHGELRRSDMTAVTQARQRLAIEVEKEREQASKVNFVIGTGRSEDLTKPTSRIRITNSSEEPIFDVAILWGTQEVSFRADEVHPTGVDGSEYSLIGQIASLGTRSMYFRDSKGVHWERMYRGELVKSDPQTFSSAHNLPDVSEPKMYDMTFLEFPFPLILRESQLDEEDRA